MKYNKTLKSKMFLKVDKGEGAPESRLSETELFLGKWLLTCTLYSCQFC